MPVVNGAEAAQTLLGYNISGRTGACLYWVWEAYRAHGAQSAQSYPTAYSAWLVTKKRHTDTNPPAGAAVWFGRRSDGNLDGDVTISLGGGKLAATDQPTWGRVGTCTLPQRGTLTARTYLGWTEDFLGNTVVQVAAPAINTTEEDDMIIRIAGKAGARNGGLYYVRNGKATFMGNDPNTTFPLISDEAVIAKLQASIEGLR